MSVFTSNLLIHTGTDFEQTFIFENDNDDNRLDLSEYTACAALKKYESSSPAGVFDVTFTNRYLGKVSISMTSSTTLNLKPGKYFYDLLLKSPTGTTTRVVEGTALVKKSVTR